MSIVRRSLARIIENVVYIKLSHMIVYTCYVPKCGGIHQKKEMFDYDESQMNERQTHIHTTVSELLVSILL